MSRNRLPQAADDLCNPLNPMTVSSCALATLTPGALYALWATFLSFGSSRRRYLGLYHGLRVKIKASRNNTGCLSSVAATRSEHAHSRISLINRGLEKKVADRDLESAGSAA
jgi:hypothetical protein